MSNASSSCFRLTLIIAVALVAVVLVSLTAVPSAHATIIANASAQLESLTITAPCNCISFLPEAESDPVAQNRPLGEFVRNRDVGSTVASAATVTWAHASAMADALTLNESSVAGVNIPFGVSNAFADGYGRSNLFDLAFSIEGTQPVTVHFSAIVPWQQSIFTGSGSQTRAFSNTNFNMVLLRQGQNPFSMLLLADQSPHTVGENSSFATSGTFNLATSYTFNPATFNQCGVFICPVSLTVQLNAIAQGSVGTTPPPPTVPEPSSLAFWGTGLLPVIGVIRRRYLNR